MYFHAKLLAYRSSYCIRQNYNVRTGSSATVDQYQRLLIVHSRIPQAFTFPTALFNHPASRNLHMRSIHLIGWHGRIFLQQRFIFCTRNNRIHEKASCVSKHFRIGQFTFANAHNHLSDRCQINLGIFLQFLTNRAIVQRVLFSLIQSKSYMSHKERFHVRSLKHTVPIGITTLFNAENSPVSVHIHRFHTAYQIFHFDAIGTNILYGAGSYLTGYQGKILSTIISALYAISNKIIPNDTCKCC